MRKPLVCLSFNCPISVCFSRKRRVLGQFLATSKILAKFSTVAEWGPDPRFVEIGAFG